MTSLAPLLQAWFTDRLERQRQCSPHTIAAYRDAFRLLLAFAQEQLRKPPSALDLQDLDAGLVARFLDDLEKRRRNSARTRNARLAAVHSFFQFAATREPAQAGLIQRVLAISPKRHSKPVIAFLGADEIDALLAAPDRATWIGKRDHALLLFMLQTGLRVSEVTALGCGDVQLGGGPHVRCMGKGRKERCTPLTASTVAVLRAWLREREYQPTDPLFTSRTASRLTRDAVGLVVARYLAVAQERCPSLRRKRVTPHVLRHTTAMQLLHAGIDRSVIALWLGHESIETTEVYLHADMAIKERALARTAPPLAMARRFRPSDSLLAFLEGL